MGRLNFKDIGDDWTPSAISIVDSPDHPLAVFEVYEDDEEFVKKSLNLEGELMEDKHEEQMVSGPVSFFEKLIGRTNVVVKSEEAPAEPPEKQPEKGKDELLEEIQKLNDKIDKMEERVTKLEKGEDEEKPEETPEENPTDNVVTKNEDDTPEDPTENVVTKSREVDPDSVTVTSSEQTRYERMGRNSNGMTW